MERYIRKFYFSANGDYDYTSELLEKTFDISSDVNILYNLFFKNFFIKLQNKEFKSYEDIKKNYYKLFFSNEKGFDKTYDSDTILFGSIETSKLRSKDCKEADRLNPLIIYCGVFKGGSYYKTKVYNVNNPYIIISLNQDALFFYFNKYFSSNLNKNAKIELRNTLSPKNIKLALTHELSHWLDDSLHGGFLTSLMDLSSWLENEDILKLKQKNINITYFEINAQVNAIKNLRTQKDLKKWDTLTFEDLFFEYPSLRRIAQDIYSKYKKEVLEIWEKYLMKRLARENLLGKNMKHFVNIHKLNEELFRIY